MSAGMGNYKGGRNEKGPEIAKGTGGDWWDQDVFDWGSFIVTVGCGNARRGVCVCVYACVFG